MSGIVYGKISSSGSNGFGFGGGGNPVWVELTVNSAINVTDKEKCKIYCIVEHNFGAYTARTKAKKTNNPLWDQSFYLDISKDPFVKLSVWDKEAFGTDEYLGEVTFEVTKYLGTALASGSQHQPIESSSSGTGSTIVHSISSTSSTSTTPRNNRKSIPSLITSGPITPPVIASASGSSVTTSTSSTGTPLTARSSAPDCQTTKENLLRFSLRNSKGRFGSVSGEITVTYKVSQVERPSVVPPDFKRLKRRAERKANTSSHKRRHKLDLSNSRLVDEIPSFVWETSSDWTHVNLSFNLFPKFPTIGQLKHIRYLDIGYCNLSDLEPELGTLPSLKELYMPGNKLSGLTSAVNNLVKLKKLDISFNSLTVLGGEVGHFTKLEELVLRGNPLVLVSPELGVCTNLQVLDFSCCRLLGLPDEIGELVNLTELNLTVNNVAELPPTVGKLVKLASLHLSHNQLADLPDTLAECKNLMTVTVEGGNALDPELIKKSRQGSQALVQYLVDRKEAARRAMMPPSAMKRSSEHQDQPKKSKMSTRLSWAVFGGSTEEKSPKSARASLEPVPPMHVSSGRFIDPKLKRLSMRLMGAFGIDEKPSVPIVQEGVKGHQFVKVQFFGQVPCFQCKKQIWGMGKNGYECTACKVPVHKKCAEMVPHNCGDNTFVAQAKSRRRSMFVSNLENELKATSVLAQKKNEKEGTARDPTFLFLVQACKLGDAKLLRRLLFETTHSRPEHLRIQHNLDSNTPIHFACYFGHTECVQCLLEKDPDLINCRNGAGMTPFHTAAKVGKEDCLKLLISKGAEVNGRDYMEGATALHHAAERGKITCVKLLLENGANPALTNAKGKTALDKALLRGYMEIAVLLGHAPKTSAVEEEEISLFGFEREDSLAWLRKRIHHILDAFELVRSDFSLFDINGDGELEVGELMTQLGKNDGFQSLATNLLSVIEKADEKTIIDIDKFFWLMYKLLAGGDETSLGKDGIILQKGFHILEKCFKKLDPEQTGEIDKSTLVNFLADLNGVSAIDVQNSLDHEKQWRFLEKVNSIDFEIFSMVLRQWQVAEIIDIEVTCCAEEGAEKKKSYYKILDTIGLYELKEALSDAFHIPEIDLQYTRAGTNQLLPLKKDRDLQTAIVSFKSRRSSKNSKLRLTLTKRLAPVTSRIQPKLPPPMSKPKIALSLDVKKAEEAIVPPIVHWLRSPDREKSSWEVPYSEMELGKQIGRGAYGEVFEGKFRGKRVAIKKLLGTIRNEEVFKDFLREIELLAKLDHGNILKFYGACLEYPDLCIVTEFCDRGCVFDVITKENVDWCRLVTMGIQAAKGIQHIHKQKPPIVHKDIKSYNFLVAEDYKVVVADFGCAEFLETEESRYTTKLGTFNWMPPEAFDQGVYDERSDIYSFGMVLWEMLTAGIPYGTVGNQLMVHQLIDAGERPHIPASSPEPFANLIRSCWDAVPENRPTWDKIIATLESMIEP